MPRPASTQPTDVELQILQVLWELGPSSVRDVHNRMCLTKQIVYATTKKMLLVMWNKGLVKRDDTVKPIQYRAASSQQQTQQRMLSDFIQKAFAGSAKSLLIQALSSAKASKEDLDEIRRMLDESD